jgi:hypothetical protein
LSSPRKHIPETKRKYSSVELGLSLNDKKPSWQRNYLLKNVITRDQRMKEKNASGGSSRLDQHTKLVFI